ncbi:hypothetical protein K450DRAFT_270097 [Umbelopsis ramanniana AG]|uniref:Endonuclease/exonuclease/phosphatase domain-containing protein n=1 Tax=Umbelopsis ramanniana AG TaxID=1314678 RepID=A0AAD5EEQ8_UMBRA|nr:uncharacterized protein K450DRAFT_270097 [Umbelopsis ramanniana AG]KAI8581576.1 hypothetical protein K450DRAFT_270097 [Umbelopsis ramanniana AG]
MTTLKIMTFNVRFDLNQVPERQSADTSLDGEQPWSTRKWKIADTILLYEPEIVGLQEPRHHQVLDLAELLSADYVWVGCGRSDGKEDGEYSPIFYKRYVMTTSIIAEGAALNNENNRQILSEANSKTIWLSETPDQPGSVGWDADQTRIATVVTFDVKTDNGQKQIRVINTHFDNKGEKARKESAGLLLKELSATQLPMVVIGDLNSEEDSAPYLELTSHQYTKSNESTGIRIEKLNRYSAVEEAKRTGMPTRTPGHGIALPTHIQFRPHKLDPKNLQPIVQQHGFKDARYELQTRLEGFPGFSGPYGHQNTFTSFGAPGEDPPSVIDYILLGNEVKVTKFAVLENRYDDKLYISDHRPVMATVSF